MAKFDEASAYRNTPRLSTPSLDKVAWAIFCGYFVPLQAALSSFIFTIIVALVEWILVHNHGGWLSSSLSLWFSNSAPPPSPPTAAPSPSLPVCHNTLHLHAWVRVWRKHLKARGTCLKILGMELHSEHLHFRLSAQKGNWIGWPTNRFFRLTLLSALLFRLQSCHQGKGFLPQMLNLFCALHVDHFGSRSSSKHVGSRCLNARTSRL